MASPLLVQVILSSVFCPIHFEVPEPGSSAPLCIDRKLASLQKECRGTGRVSIMRRGTSDKMKKVSPPLPLQTDLHLQVTTSSKASQIKSREITRPSRIRTSLPRK